MKKVSLALTAIFIAFAGIAFGQEKFGQMRLSPLGELPQVVRASTHSVLVVRSEIPNIRIESNSLIRRMEKISPSEWRLYLEPGRQIITVHAENYISEKLNVFNFRAKRAYELRVLEAKPIPGTLVVISEPAGASLRVDGVAVEGRTPLTLDNLSPGIHRVAASKQGYQTLEEDVKIQAQNSKIWSPALQQTRVRVIVEFKNDVDEVAILANGETIGVAPGEIYLEPGPHLLIFQKQGYKDFEKPLIINLGQGTLLVREKLARIDGSLLSKWYFWTAAATVATGSFLVLDPNSSKPQPLLPESPDFPQ